MARRSPQLEDGYTRLSNELLEALLRARIRGNELRIVLAVARLTYGWGLKAREISYRDIAEICSIDRRSVIRTMCGLKRKGILQHKSGKRGEPAVWSIQKDYSKWKGCGKVVTEEPLLIHSGGQSVTRSGGQTVTTPGGQSVTSSDPRTRISTGVSGRLKKNVKKGKKNVNVTTKARARTIESKEPILTELIGYLRDKKSLPFYRKIVELLPTELIRKILSEVKDLELTGRLRRSRAACFAYLVKQALQAQALHERPPPAVISLVERLAAGKDLNRAVGR